MPGAAWASPNRQKARGDVKYKAVSSNMEYGAAGASGAIGRATGNGIKNKRRNAKGGAAMA
jgi:hypothetical protein